MTATEAVHRELRAWAARLREAAPRWYAVAAPPFASRADVAFHVVRRIAELGFRLECPGQQVPALPRLHDMALPDQFDVVSRDLVAVLDDQHAGAILAELLLHRRHLDGAAAGPMSTAAVVAATGLADEAAWQRACELSAPLQRP